MAIDFQRKQYQDALPIWEKIDDIVHQKNLKNYLLKLNPHDKSIENEKRNDAYFKRAVFYAVSSQTLESFVATMFNKEPKLEVPDSMEYVKNNVDGSGVSIYQQSQATAGEVIAKGRAGLVVSYPQVDGAISQADLDAGLVAATIQQVDAEQIINWRTRTIGSRTFLELVVIKEVQEQVAEDGYSIEDVDAIRELFLDENGVYSERVWVEDIEDKWVVRDKFTPTKSNGSFWTNIPFQFVGAENNDWHIDDAPLKGIVDLNIGHYRNSADYEDSVFYSGQVQPWMSGMTQDHIDMLKTNGMYVGSRQMLATPEGGQFDFAQADPNPMVRQAMLDKVEQMASLGARLVESGSAAKTATQSAGEQEVANSKMSLIAQNISEAYSQCLQWMGEYMGVSDAEMEYELNSDFSKMEIVPQVFQAVVTAFERGSIPADDYVHWMKKHGFFREDVSNDDYRELVSVNSLMDMS